jgi:rare lipoprotein A
MGNGCRGGLLGFIGLLAALHGPCSGAAAEPGTPKKAVSRPAGPVQTKEPGSRGTASYYAKRFHGRKTASGEPHRPAEFTAAHPDLPFGTKVRVVHLGTKRETVVRINDRCRRRRAPTIDLSRAAASQLGILKEGRALVRIIPLPPGSPDDAVVRTDDF